MNDKKKYQKWVGVLLGILLNGSAHFLSGKRSAGVKWFFGLFFCGLAGIALIATPGTATYILGATFLLASLGLWLVMLKQSYRPIQRIGFLGWLAVIILAVVLNSGTDYFIDQLILSYRMPTGSMEPTICGIHVDSVDKPSLVQQVICGQRYLEIKAKNSGILSGPPRFKASPQWVFSVGSQPYELPLREMPLKKVGGYVLNGETLWSGTKTSGDRVFIERLSYRFRDPKRGDIVVFKTDGIEGARPGTFYIKRIAGLPGERVRIDPPYLFANEQKVVEPEIFSIMSSKVNGYSGFVLALDKVRGTAAKLINTNDFITLGGDEYFVTGDNSPNSLDSRYYGPVPRKNIIGKVTRIYYPFSRINKLKSANQSTHSITGSARSE